MNSVATEGLRWVRAELDISLERVRACVDDFLMAPGQAFPLQRGMVELHQIRGTLCLLRCEDAALLAEEMRNAVHDLLQDLANVPEPALEVLLASTVQLSDYLDLIANGEDGSALVFLPLINELRVARSAGVLAEADLFVRYCGLLWRNQQRTPGDFLAQAPGAQALARRTLPVFHSALLNLLRNRQVPESLTRMATLVADMATAVPDGPAHQMFVAGGALLEGLRDQGMDTDDLEASRLLGEIAGQLKAVAEHGAEALAKVPDKLLFTILFRVGRSASSGEQVSAVRAEYDLENRLPTAAELERMRTRLRRPNTALVAQLSAAIKTDFATAKDSIQKALSADDTGIQGEVVPVLARIADTLGMLGLDSLQRIISKQVRAIQEPAAEDASSADRWMTLALALLRVEQNLDRSLVVQVSDAAGPRAATLTDEPRDELDAAAIAVVREALVDLRRFKQLIFDFLADAANVSGSAIARPLQQIAGGLRVLGREPTAQLVDAAYQFITGPSGSEVGANPHLARMFAEAIAAIELHLEALHAGQPTAEESCRQAQLALQALSQSAGKREQPSAGATAWVEADGALPQTIDPVIRNTFLDEAEEVLGALQRDVPAWSVRLDDGMRLAAIRRSFHSLEGSARMVLAGAISELTGAVEALLNRCLQGACEVDVAVVGVVHQAMAALPGLIEDFRNRRVSTAPESIIANARQMLADDVQPRAAGAEPGLSRVFHDEASRLLQQMQAQLSAWTQAPVNRQHPRILNRLCHQLQGSAPVAGADGVGSVARALRHAISAIEISEGGLDPDTSQVFQRVLANIHSLLEHRGPGDVEPLLEQLRNITDSGQGTAASAPSGASAGPSGVDREDEELTNIFLDEAESLLTAIDETCRQWQARPWDDTARLDLARRLHTLKGSARVAGLATVGDVSHAMETSVEQIAAHDHQQRLPMLEALARAVEALHAMLGRVRAGNQALDAEPMLAMLREAGAASAGQPMRSGSVAATSAALEGTLGNTAACDPVTPPGQAAVARAPLAAASELDAQPRAGAAESAQVPVVDLEQMLNEAGDLNIQRAQMADDDRQLRQQLDELDRTARRMGEQLGRLGAGIEMFAREGAHTEDQKPQNVASAEQAATLREFTRGLDESVSDVVSLHGLMAELAAERAGMVERFQTVSTNLREHLIRTVMVPFASRQSRLRRVVSQAASECGREVEILFSGTEAEIDRAVLERLTGPLAHLLRNAVVHGIESPQDRIASGKRRVGAIALRLQRVGTQLVLELSDDGRGLDFAAIRDRARDGGLLAGDGEVSDDQAARFIFRPGFSTASELTQAAGRGLGLDVAHNEIKQLGGTMGVASTAGGGVCFNIRVPLTLACSQVLMVVVGGESYAVPLGSIEGVTRVPRAALVAGHDEPPATIEYGGCRYAVRPMAGLLGLPTTAEATGASGKLPAVLVRCGSSRAAVVVDELSGERDIVIKPVGPQIASVPGMSAATIQADGSVVLILDLAALVQLHMPVVAVDAAADTALVSTDQRPLALVVDDSITIRRVSERFLSRHGFRVATAPDGVAALASLEQEVPDVLLLDIEMPRMDGFELATRMRETETLAHIPILMISTRSGQAHRERAAAIGVDRFLTKPYREQQLLAHIRAVMRNRLAPGNSIVVDVMAEDDDVGSS